MFQLWIVGMALLLLLAFLSSDPPKVESPETAAVTTVQKPAPAVKVEKVEPVAEEEPPAVYDNPDIPDEVEAAAEAAGEAYGISPELLEAIAYYESRYQPDAVGAGGCLGLMQVSVRWHGARMERLGISADDMLEAEANMTVAADFIAELLSQHDDITWMLMRYNGSGNADAYLRGEAQPSWYATAVMELTEELTVKREAAEEVVRMQAEK